MKSLKSSLQDSLELQDTAVHFLKQIKQDPRNPEGYFKRGVVFYLLEDYTKALKDFSVTLKLEKTNKHAYCLLGLCLGKMKQPTKAMKSFNKALELDPEFAQAYMGRAVVLIGIKKFEEAITELEYAFSYEPDNPRIYIYLGEALIGLGEFDEAFKCFNKALDLDPLLRFKIDTDKRTAYLKAGIYRASEGSHLEAIELLTNYLNIDPTDPAVYFHLGESYMHLDDFENGRKCMEKVLELDLEHKYTEKARETFEILEEIADLEGDEY